MTCRERNECLRVYRYENAFGVGPFQSALYEEMSAAMRAAGRHDPDLWRNVKRPPNWWKELSVPRFGCSTLRQLVSWFPRPCRAVLEAHGQRLTAFDVPYGEALQGTEHVVFGAASAVQLDPAMDVQCGRPRNAAQAEPPPGLDFAATLQALGLTGRGSLN